MFSTWTKLQVFNPTSEQYTTKMPCFMLEPNSPKKVIKMSPILIVSAKLLMLQQDIYYSGKYLAVKLGK